MKRSTLRKKSAVPLTKLKAKLLEDVKKLIRESGGCAMAGVEKACGGCMQASHIYPEGIYKNLFIDPQNILPKCQMHHLYFWHRHPVAAGQWFDENYPERREYLERMKKTHLDLTPEKIAMLREATKQGLEAYQEAYDTVKPLP